MDSLPQELVDTIIDNIPESDRISCSLVAKRWQHRSQKHAFENLKIHLMYEKDVKDWYTSFPQGSPHVRFVKLLQIYVWNDPARFCRVLKGLTSLTTLEACATQIPGEFLDYISRGGFGKKITTLTFRWLYCTHTTLMSMILSSPSLKRLTVGGGSIILEDLLPIHSITSHRGPLELLDLHGNLDTVGKTLVESQFTSSHLSLDVATAHTEQLIVLSSRIVVELELHDDGDLSDFDCVHLPSLPVLTTLVLNFSGVPSRRLTNMLSSIDSAPSLTSVAIGRRSRTTISRLPLSLWVDMDRWLARIAKRVKVKGGLSLTLRWWRISDGRKFWRAFRESGGVIKMDDTW